MIILTTSSADSNNGALVPPLTAKRNLLTLPTEIRVMVYKLLYPPGIPTIKPNTKDDTTEIQQPTALIKTCSKIYREVGPFMYRNIFITAYDVENLILSNNPFVRNIEKLTMKLHPVAEVLQLSLSEAQRCLARAELPSLKACTFIAPVHMRFYHTDGSGPRVTVWTLLKHLVRLQPQFDRDLMEKVESGTLVLNYVASRGEVKGEVNYRFDIKGDLVGKEYVEQFYDAAYKAHTEVEQNVETPELDIMTLINMMMDI